MAVTDVVGDLGISLGSGASATSTFLINFFGILLAGAIVGIITYFIAMKMSFNKHIHKFEDVSGNTSPMGDDKAREIVLPHTSTRAFYLRKHKIYLPRPSLQTGKGHYWYFVRKDGEWVNCRPRFNEKTGEVDLTFDHADMRLANASLKKLVEKNYKRTNWIKEYAPYIAIGLLILMLGITFFLIIGETQKVTGGLSGAANNLAEAIKLQNEILESLDNIKNADAGSGIRDG